jgi:sugar phosphate isomerase/epimerase
VGQIGLQLWTIRDECERDLAGALRRVGAQGYDGVELIPQHDHEPAQVRAWLDEAGLVAAGRHTGLDAVERELPQLAQELRLLGTDRIVISWIAPERLAQPHDVVARLAVAAEAARDAGLRLGFHNHSTEPLPIAGGATFLDLLRRLPPDLIWLELDLGWIWHAGADPVLELEASRGRCPLVHVKDFMSRDGHDDVPVGDGNVCYERVLPAALAAGVEWLIAEEDDVDGEAFAAVERSLAGIRRILASC